MYVVQLGDQTGVVSLQSIRQELSSDEYRADRAMLDAVAEALKFVAELRVGDPLPSEIIDGTPSWQPEARHHKTANRRIVAAMVRWSGEWEGPVIATRDLRRFLEDEVDKEKIARALGRLEDAVANAEQGPGEIQQILLGLTEHLAYIEALREKVARIRRIGAILERVRRRGGGQANDTQEAAAVLRVFNHMMLSFDAMLASVDDKITDIEAAVLQHEAVGDHIGKVRNGLYRALTVWNEPLRQWDDVNTDKFDMVEVAPKVAELYRFLAPLYAPVDEWERINSYRGKDEADQSAGSGGAAGASIASAPDGC